VFDVGVFEMSLKLSNGYYVLFSLRHRKKQSPAQLAAKRRERRRCVLDKAQLAAIRADALAEVAADLADYERTKEELQRHDDDMLHGEDDVASTAAGVVAERNALKETLAEVGRIVEPLREIETKATPGPWPAPLVVAFVELEVVAGKEQVKCRELVGRLQLFAPDDRQLLVAARNVVGALLVAIDGTGQHASKLPDLIEQFQTEAPNAFEDLDETIDNIRDL
jgi:hypothetical protein